jgi:ferric-dicitrate binding protein FerR (iron transport regulator)
MSMKYRLPCGRCGEKLVIDVSQAGRQLECRCGATVEAPSLRAIRALEPAADSLGPARRASWNRGRGVTFAAGVLVAVLGLLVAASSGASWYTAQPPPQPSAQDIETALAQTDTLAATEAWDAWLNLRDEGLGPYHEPPHSLFQTSVRRVFAIFVGGLVAMGVGTAAAVLSMLLPGTRS